MEKDASISRNVFYVSTNILSLQSLF